MTHPALRAFVTWPFIASLAILIANDTWLKANYPGLLTGKLSDIFGIAIVAIPFLAAYPKKYYLVAAAISASFLWWKSPASEPFITWVNSTQELYIARVVDYTDLMALVIIPACKYVTSNMERILIPVPILHKLAIFPLATLTMAAMLGTSQMPLKQDAEISSKSASGGIDAQRASEIFRKLADQYGLECRDCSQLPHKGTYQGKGFTISYAIIGTSTISLKTESFTNWPLPGRGGLGRAEEFRNALKRALAKEFSSLVYTEELH